MKISSMTFMLLPLPVQLQVLLQLLLFKNAGWASLGSMTQLLKMPSKLLMHVQKYWELQPVQELLDWEPYLSFCVLYDGWLAMPSCNGTFLV